jgi:nucleotide-binding universal stress UspA family protein
MVISQILLTIEDFGRFIYHWINNQRKEVCKMFEKVLVPLDGSELAECALPYVMNLAREGMAKELILLNVVEIPSLALSGGIDFFSLKNALFANAQKYFIDLQTKIVAEGVKVRTEVLEGRPTQSIVEYSKGNAVDLIVIATHGYTGMRQLMFGSVALRVLHDAHTPVLLIRPESCR